jgi:hypothetical protein
MKRLRLILVLVLLAVLAGAAWVWYATPVPVDLANYAPANALVYMEFDNLADVARTIQHTDIWKAAAPITGNNGGNDNRLFVTAARAGIGPIENVLLARTQVALVVVGLNTSEEGDTLKVRPEFAVIAETHTSRWRTVPVMVEAVKRLANLTFGATVCSGPQYDGDRFECHIPGTDRTVIGSISGTTIILANGDDALGTVLDARGGRRPSIGTDPEFLRSRSSVATQQSLGFGYISSANSGKLFFWTAVQMGFVPADPQLQQLLVMGATSILRTIAWTALPADGGIEDRFFFSLDPDVVARLQPAFETSRRDENIWKLVPDNFKSLTIYRSREPAAAWKSLDTTVSFKLDVLPAVFFGSLLSSSLVGYGIENPKATLPALSPPLLTMKTAAGAEGSILIARVSDEALLRKALQQQSDEGPKPQLLDGLQSDPDPAREFAAVFADGYVLLGRTENVVPCLVELRKRQAAAVAANKKNVQDSARENTAAIVTYANDEARLTSFISTLLLLQGRSLSSEELGKLQSTFGDSSFAETETRLSAAGIERKTRSAFGQFSTLIALLKPTPPNSVARQQ